MSARRGGCASRLEIYVGDHCFARFDVAAIRSSSAVVSGAVVSIRSESIFRAEMSFLYSTQRLSYSRRFWEQTRVCGRRVLSVCESFVIQDLHGLCGHSAQVGGGVTHGELAQ